MSLASLSAIPLNPWKRSAALPALRWLLPLLLLAASPKAQGFKYWDPADTSKTPRLISQTGFFANLSVDRKPIAAANYFEVNSALWSDGSHKQDRKSVV